MEAVSPEFAEAVLLAVVGMRHEVVQVAIDFLGTERRSRVGPEQRLRDDV